MRSVLTLLLCLLAVPVLAANTAKPSVPAGTDPGGVAVAIVETGVDYTIPAIAARLARDGEGEIIGWDNIDSDRRPFKVKDDLEAISYTHRGTAMARTVLKRAKTSRLELVRIDTGSEASIREGLAFVAQTPAKIAVLSLKTSKASLWAAVRDSMLYNGPKYLLVVAAGEDDLDQDRIKEHLAPSLNDLENVIVVTACNSNGKELTTAEGAATTADVAVNTEAFTAELLTADTFEFKPEASIAAAEVAAIAARLFAKDPSLSPGQIKAAILNAAKSYPEGQVAIAKSGWIAEPWRQFPAE